MWNLLSSTGFGVDVSLLQEQERTMNSMSEKDTGEALCTGNQCDTSLPGSQSSHSMLEDHVQSTAKISEFAISQAGSQ